MNNPSWFKAPGSAHLRGDDLDGRHEAVSDDGHSQEHVHQGDEVDHGAGHLVPEARLLGLPHRQQDALGANRLLVALIRTAGGGAVPVRQRRRQRGGGRRGQRRPRVRLDARVDALRLRLAGGKQDGEEEEEEGRRTGEGKHGGAGSHKPREEEEEEEEDDGN